MADKNLDDIIGKLKSGKQVERDVWHYLLTSLDKAQKETLYRCAADIAVSNFGHGIFIRGLIEISSYCKNNCYYCGLRCSNNEAQRYRLSKDEILDCCRKGASLGFNTFVLQGGEDPMQNDEWIIDVVSSIKKELPDKAVTLSVGERNSETYRAFRKAGADRYLLRHETRNETHYSLLHPETMSATKRRNCLFELKNAGFQTGSGMMIGSPYQTTENLIDDILFLEELQPQMIGIGPFIPAKGTPFENSSQGTTDMTVLMIALLRLRFPKALIPATTALATIDEKGREQAILAGANVVMPNLSPCNVRKKYSIYNKKLSTGSEAAEQLQLLNAKLNTIGYHINYNRGDYNNVEHNMNRNV